MFFRREKRKKLPASCSHDLQLKNFLAIQSLKKDQLVDWTPLVNFQKRKTERMWDKCKSDQKCKLSDSGVENSRRLFWKGDLRTETKDFSTNLSALIICCAVELCIVATVSNNPKWFSLIYYYCYMYMQHYTSRLNFISLGEANHVLLPPQQIDTTCHLHNNLTKIVWFGRLMIQSFSPIFDQCPELPINRYPH